MKSIQSLAGGISSPQAFADLLAFAEGKWQPDHGCAYVDLTASGALQEIFGFNPPEDISAELLKIVSELTPHLHNHSDSVVAVYEANGGQYFENGVWRPLENGQQVSIPRGKVHGFKANRDHFFAVVVSNPPIDDDDTVYAHGH